MCFKYNKRCNVKIFNIIAGIDESNSLAEHISCDIKCRFYEKI